MLRVLVYDTSIGGVMLRQGRASNLWLYVFGHLVFWPTVLEEGCIVLSDTYSWKLECLDSSPSSTSAFYLDDVLVGPTRFARMASHFHCYCLEDSYDVLLNFGGPQGIEPIEEVLGNFHKMLKRLWEPGFYLEFCAQGSESVSPFHLFHLFIDWSELVGSLWLLVCWGCLFGAFLLLLYVADQSLRSSCLPMTTLAQLHDCHSCNEERSIVQKKKLHRGSVFRLFKFTLLLIWCFCIQWFLRHLYPFVAIRRATARTTETLSHAASSQKKCQVRSLPTFTRSFHPSLVASFQYSVDVFQVMQTYPPSPVPFSKRSLLFRTINIRAFDFRPLALAEKQATHDLSPLHSTQKRSNDQQCPNHSQKVRVVNSKRLTKWSNG